MKKHKGSMSRKELEKEVIENGLEKRDLRSSPERSFKDKLINDSVKENTVKDFPEIEIRESSREGYDMEVEIIDGEDRYKYLKYQVRSSFVAGHNISKLIKNGNASASIVPDPIYERDKDLDEDVVVPILIMLERVLYGKEVKDVSIQ